MNRFLLIVVLFAVLFSCGKNNSQGELYSGKIEITVVNPLDLQRVDQAVGISLTKIRQKDEKFNENNFIVSVQDSEIAYQLVDHNRDGVNDGVLILLDMKPKENVKVVINYNEKGKSVHKYAARTHAELSKKFGGKWDGKFYKSDSGFKNAAIEHVPAVHSDHSRYYRYEGPGWESDKIGYRFYLDWRNAIDIFGKKTSEMVLKNVGLDDWESYHSMNDWGMDILKVGPSLGMGAVAAWRNNKVEMVSKVDSTTLNIAIDGALCSAIVTDYYGWQLGEKKYDLRSRLSIKGGSRLTRNDLKIDPSIEALCTGLVKSEYSTPLEVDDNAGDWTYLAQYGKQSLNKDNLGMAILYKKSDLQKLTEDKYSRIVVLSPKDGKLSYYFLAAWELEPGGVNNENDFKVYLNNTITKLNNPVQIIF